MMTDMSSLYQNIPTLGQKGDNVVLLLLANRIGRIVEMHADSREDWNQLRYIIVAPLNEKKKKKIQKCHTLLMLIIRQH